MAKIKRVDITAELVKVRKKQGTLTAKGLLKAAKAKRHPLHACFDWEDTQAAGKWRVHQANLLISQAKVTITANKEKTIHAFVSVKTDKGREFINTVDAIGDGRLLLQIFEQLNSRIENIQEQLSILGLLQGTIEKALITAKAPIAKQRDKLKKTA